MKTHIDGPGLAEMVTTRLAGRPLTSLGANFSRRVNAWKHGEHPCYERADAYLMELPDPIHEFEIPEELWRDHPQRGKTFSKARNEAAKKKALALAAKGYGPKAIAKRVGCHPRTVLKWTS